MTRRFENDVAGFVVAVHDGVSDTIPLYCPVCDTALRTRDDEISYTRYSCCSACELEWVHLDVAAWQQNKRPSAQEIESAVSKRPGISVNIECS